MRFQASWIAITLTAFINLQALQIGTIFMISEDKDFPESNTEVKQVASSLCQCKNLCLKTPDCRGVICMQMQEGYMAKTFSSPDIPLIFNEVTRSFCKIHGNCLLLPAQIDQGMQLGRIRLIDVGYGKPARSLSVFSPNGGPENLVDRNDTTNFHSKSQGMKEWASIDLGQTFYVAQISMTGRPAWKNRYGDFKVFISDEFDPDADFSTYSEILEVVGNAASDSVTYNCTSIVGGRFLTIYRQIPGILETLSLEALAIN